MLLHSLHSDDAQLKQATLETLVLMVEETPLIIAEHINTIVKILIQLFSSEAPAQGNNPVSACVLTR